MRITKKLGSPSTAELGENCDNNGLDCVSGAFCNYDYEISGFCESCNDVSNANNCANEGFNHNGNMECSRVCFSTNPGNLGCPQGTVVITDRDNWNQGYQNRDKVLIEYNNITN